MARAALAAAFLLSAGALAHSFLPKAYADGPAVPTPDVAAPPITEPAPPVRAAPLPPSPTAEPASAPDGRSGAIEFEGGAFGLAVPTSYKFYSAEEAQAFLQRTGAAAPSGAVLGLVAPADTDVRAEGAWATVVSYDAIGHVAADSATGLEDTNFEADVRAARASQNRAFEGFAMAPVFDPAAANLTWAERTAAPAAGGNDLRHEQKLLSRRGVAGLTSLGSADQQGAMVAASPDLVGMVQFSEDQAYGAFEAASDPASAYGVPQLVTGVSGSADHLIAEGASVNGGTRGGGGLAGLFPWIALGVIALAGAGFLMTRKRADPNLAPPADEE
jgi:hypothetical protein